MSRIPTFISVLTERRILTLSSLIIGLVIVGFTSIQDGEALFPDKEPKIKSNSSNADTPSNFSTKCQGLADCFDGTVTEVVDGDTLDVNNVRIRLALIDAPEENETGYFQARHFVESSCNVGSEARVDEDDRQKGGSFGRMIAQVYCGNKPTSINEAILNSGFATIYQEFCNVSEFATNGWAVKSCSDNESRKEQSAISSSTVGNESTGIDAKTINATVIGKHCDPSYPDFCIRSPPPDLDCNDTSQKEFTVRGSDPHGFDLDGNGEGCES